MECPTCECPKDEQHHELHRTELYPVRSSAKISAGVEKAKGVHCQWSEAIPREFTGQWYHMSYHSPSSANPVTFMTLLYTIMTGVIRVNRASLNHLMTILSHNYHTILTLLSFPLWLPLWHSKVLWHYYDILMTILWPFYGHFMTML